jgi:nucleoside-diphosphate-sugar epimerase
VTINGLVDAIERVTGRVAHRLHNETESGGVSRLVADVALARDKLRFRPSVELEAGLKRVLAEDAQFARAAS